MARPVVTFGTRAAFRRFDVDRSLTSSCCFDHPGAASAPCICRSDPSAFSLLGWVVQGRWLNRNTLHTYIPCVTYYIPVIQTYQTYQTYIRQNTQEYIEHHGAPTAIPYLRTIRCISFIVNAHVEQSLPTRCGRMRIHLWSRVACHVPGTIVVEMKTRLLRDSVRNMIYFLYFCWFQARR